VGKTMKKHRKTRENNQKTREKSGKSREDFTKSSENLSVVDVLTDHSNLSVVNYRKLLANN